MMTYTENILHLFPFKGHDLQAHFYQPTTAEMKTVILYFHGGGFVYGNRDDLPGEYIDMLTAAGIGLVAVDYPLAPETKFPVILDVTNKVTAWFVNQFLSDHQLETYFILGRSAGSYLALASGIYTEHLSIRPTGILALYGYFNLNDATFNLPNRHYLQYPKVSEQIIKAQIKTEPLFNTPDKNRYLVYVAARQTGDWLNLFLADSDQKSAYSLDKTKLKELPPLFLSAAVNDPDVPVRQSRQLANLHSDATLYLVDLDAHDFDRTHLETHGKELYTQMISWMLNWLA